MDHAAAPIGQPIITAASVGLPEFENLNMDKATIMSCLTVVKAQIEILEASTNRLVGLKEFCDFNIWQQTSASLQDHGQVRSGPVQSEHSAMNIHNTAVQQSFQFSDEFNTPGSTSPSSNEEDASSAGDCQLENYSPGRDDTSSNGDEDQDLDLNSTSEDEGKRNDYACIKCFKTFTSQWKLNDHQISHKINVKRINCSHCNKSYLRQRDLRKHMRKYLKHYKCQQLQHDEQHKPQQQNDIDVMIFEQSEQL
ncbi:hypothetical protein DFH27DRAFT_277486 [Peziza echinospora]|nr:hypothetical protein DFH27DRAFT_277486 [Peziza echinospora]